MCVCARARHALKNLDRKKKNIMVIRLLENLLVIRISENILVILTHEHL